MGSELDKKDVECHKVLNCNSTARIERNRKTTMRGGCHIRIENAISESVFCFTIPFILMSN